MNSLNHLTVELNHSIIYYNTIFKKNQMNTALKMKKILSVTRVFGEYFYLSDG